METGVQRQHHRTTDQGPVGARFPTWRLLRAVYSSDSENSQTSVYVQRGLSLCVSGYLGPRCFALAWAHFKVTPARCAG